MKLKIISDGTPHGSKVIDEMTGEMVENIEFISIMIHATEGVTGTIRFTQLQLDFSFSTPPAG